MRTKRTLRYFCDFCKKAGGSKHHMVKHERGCTLNPDRECGLCALVEEVQPSYEELKAAALIGLDELRKVAQSCPACMLTGRRAIKDALIAAVSDEMPCAESVRLLDWDFKAERESWFADYNSTEHAWRNDHY